MKNDFASRLSAAALALGLFGAVPVLAQNAMDKPAGMISDTVSLNATVTRIDKKDRWVTLKLADGTTFDVQAGPAVKNFAQIKVGDKVTASQEESMAISVVSATGAPPNITGGSTMLGAPAGSKPMGVQVDLLTVTGKVTAIDYTKRLVTLKGPKGNSHTIQVGPAVEKLNEVKKGDEVVVNVKRVTTIEVSAPKK